MRLNYFQQFIGEEYPDEPRYKIWMWDAHRQRYYSAWGWRNMSFYDAVGKMEDNLMHRMTPWRFDNDKHIAFDRDEFPVAYLERVF